MQTKPAVEIPFLLPGIGKLGNNKTLEGIGSPTPPSGSWLKLPSPSTKLRKLWSGIMMILMEEDGAGDITKS
jgi:hypothetical protein